MNLTSRIALISAFSTVAASPFTAPAMAATASAESSVADAMPATESETENLAAFRFALRPDGSVMGCPLWWLKTRYGPVGQCTVQLNGQGRVGLYSPLTRAFIPTTPWLPLINYAPHDFFDGSGRVVGYTTLNTPYGPATFATKYQVLPQGRRGNWGNYNFFVKRYHPGDNWLPVTDGR